MNRHVSFCIFYFIPFFPLNKFWLSPRTLASPPTNDPTGSQQKTALWQSCETHSLPHRRHTPNVTSSAFTVSGQDHFPTTRGPARGCTSPRVRPSTWREGLHALGFLIPGAVMKVFLFNCVDFIPVILRGTKTPRELIGSSSLLHPSAPRTLSPVKPEGPGAAMMRTDVPSPGSASQNFPGSGDAKGEKCGNDLFQGRICIFLCFAFVFADLWEENALDTPGFEDPQG